MHTDYGNRLDIGCSLYTDNPGYCADNPRYCSDDSDDCNDDDIRRWRAWGRYRSDFRPLEMCCICGGGFFASPTTTEPTTVLMVTSGFDYCRIDANGCATNAWPAEFNDGANNDGNERCTIAVLRDGLLGSVGDVVSSSRTDNLLIEAAPGGRHQYLQRFRGRRNVPGGFDTYQAYPPRTPTRMANILVLAGSTFSWTASDDPIALSGWTVCWTPYVCDAPAAPTNGAVGNCTSTLAGGSTCQPTCNPGYTVSGTSLCLAGGVTAATCNPTGLFPGVHPSETTALRSETCPACV